MFPRHIHHISIPNNAIMSEKWAKKAQVSSPPKCSTQHLKNTQKLSTVHSTMTLHVVKYGTFVLWRQHIGMTIT